MYASAALLVLFTFNVLPASAAEERTLSASFHEDHIGDVTVYVSDALTVAQTLRTVTEWKELRFPSSWPIESPSPESLRFELWNAKNRPIPQFRARYLTSTTVDLGALDATLVSTFRVVVFIPQGRKAPLPDTSPPLAVRTFASTNTRLFLFGGVATLLYLFVLTFAVVHRVTPRRAWGAMRAWFAGDETFSNASLASTTVVALVGSLVFGAGLGLFGGWPHVGYLLIKTPFLFLASFLLTGASQFFVLLLLGTGTSIRVAVGRSLATIATVAVTLGSAATIFGFFALRRLDARFPRDEALLARHDELLVVLGFLVVLTVATSMVRLFASMRRHGIARAAIAVVLWFVLYNLVFAQLGWMLRPWVGERNPVTGEIPFARLYGGDITQAVRGVLERSVGPF